LDVGFGGVSGISSGIGGNSAIFHDGTVPILIAPGGGTVGLGFIDASVAGGVVLLGSGPLPAGMTSINYSAGVGLGGALGFGQGGQGSIVLSFTPQATVPEPGTIILLGIGLAGLGASRRQKKRSEPIRPSETEL
jgi:hypothetical protein